MIKYNLFFRIKNTFLVLIESYSKCHLVIKINKLCVFLNSDKLWEHKSHYSHIISLGKGIKQIPLLLTKQSKQTGYFKEWRFAIAASR